jgi:small-conductance mechanosensitive channel
MDDAFRIGEYVKVGDVEGTIEKFSLRSMMLRDSKGPVYCVPYSAIPKVTNYARDWGIMKLKFNLVFGTDVEKVRKIFKKIGQEMMDNPALKDGFIEPFKSQGVRDIKDGYIIIGAKFMHKPGTQFTIRKEIFRLVQRDFDANGIKFYRSTVRVTSDSEIPEGQADGGAAAAVPDHKGSTVAVTDCAFGRNGVKRGVMELLERRPLAQVRLG